MKRTILAVALCAIALGAAITVAAFAQSAPSDPAANLGQDWQAFAVVQKHVVEDVQALVQVEQQQKKQIDDLTKQLDAEKAKSAPAVAPAPK